MLDVRLLVTFLAVERSGSFTQAAAALSFTPSAISQQMTLLENRLDAVLFERSPRGVRLTPAGEALVAHAEEIVARIGDARDELQAIAGGRAGPLRLGSFPTATAAFAAAAVRRFAAAYPHVDVKYVDGESHESLARLQARELDLALVFEFEHWPMGMDYDEAIRATDDGLEYVDLFDDPFWLVVPRDDPLAANDRIGLAQLQGRQIIGGPPWALDLRELCRSSGFEPLFDLSYRTTDFNAYQGLVAAGLGITLMPRLACGSIREDVVVVPLDRGPVRLVKLALRDEGYRSPASLAMQSILVEAARALAARNASHRQPGTRPRRSRSGSGPVEMSGSGLLTTRRRATASPTVDVNGSSPSKAARSAHGRTSELTPRTALRGQPDGVPPGQRASQPPP